MPESKLVGSQVDDVVDRLVEMRASRRFQSVSLLAPSGTGKSRIVRELYERVRAGQSPPGYWPPLTDQSEDPLAARKVLGPPHTRLVAPGGSVPEFVWVSITSGHRSDGEAAQALHQVGAQLDLHAVPVLVAVGSRATLTTRLKRYGSGIAEDVREETLSSAFAKSVEVVLGEIPMSGVALSQLRRLADRAIRLRSAKQAVADGYAADMPEDTDLASRLASDLAEIAEHLPTVVAIEDSHLLDASTARFLKNLRDLAAPVLVVGTVWPEAMDRDTYARLVADLGMTGSHTDIELKPWEPSDLMEIVVQRYPRTDAALVRAIADRFRTPLTVELFLSLRWVQRRSAAGRLDVSLDQVAAATNDDKGLYQERWNELDPLVQDALVLAMAITGAHDFKGGSAFIRQAVADVGRAFVQEPEVASGLAAAANRDHWTAELAGGIDAYREPLLSNLVLGKLGNRYAADELHELGRAAQEWLGRRLAQVDLDERILAEDDLAAQWFIALYEQVDRTDHRMLAMARLVHASALVNFADFAGAVNTIEEPFTPSTGAPEPLETRRRLLLFDALCGAGLPEKAVAIGTPLVAELLSERTVGDGELTRLRTQLGYWQRNIGDYAGSLTTYEPLIEELVRCGASHAVELLTARAGRASVLGLRGDPDAAELEFAALAAESERLLGDAHPTSLILERSRWRWAGAAGRPRSASAGLEQAYESMVQSVEMGSRHPETMFALSQLAYFVLATGDTVRAIALYEEVAGLRRSVLGPSHPHTVDSVRNLVRARITGDPDAAVPLTDGLVRDVGQSVGPAHPLTLSTRFDLLCLLLERGLTSRAVEEVRTLHSQIDARELGYVMRTFGEYGMVRSIRARLHAVLARLRESDAPDAVTVVEGWLQDLSVPPPTRRMG